MTYDEWFQSQQGVAYEGAYSFAKASWEHQQAEIEKLEGQIEQLKFAVEMAAPVMDAYCGVTRLNGFKSAAKRGGAL